MPVLIPSPYRVHAPPAGAAVDWSHPLAQGLVAYYPSNDQGRLAHDAAHGANGVKTSVIDKPDGWAFDGTASSISIATGPEVTGNFGTWSCWFRTTDSTNRQPMMWQATLAGTLGVILLSDTFSTRGLSFATEGTGNILLIGAGAKTWDGVWHHAVASFSLLAGGVCSLYMDGQLLQSATNGGAVSVSPNGILIGNRTDTFWHIWTGGIRNVAIWRRQLAAAEVMALYSEPYGMLRGPDAWRRSLAPAALAGAVQ